MSQEKITLDTRIEDVLAKHEFEQLTKEELSKDIKNLIHKVRFPENYCPECDDRMFWEGNSFNCLNCGYKPEIDVNPFAPASAKIPLVPNPQAPPVGQDPKLPLAKPKKTSILDAVNKLESGNVNKDEPAPPGSASRDANWV